MVAAPGEWVIAHELQNIFLLVQGQHFHVILKPKYVRGVEFMKKLPLDRQCRNVVRELVKGLGIGTKQLTVLGIL